jgi:5-methylcytosine-specific restriction endonuclease McrA
MDHSFKRTSNGIKQVSIARRQSIINRDKSTCYICHKILDNKNVELDHIIPKSRGGDSSASNLSVSCFQCNRSKGDKIGIEQLNRLRELKDLYDY